jgi:hypothetical protein
VIARSRLQLARVALLAARAGAHSAHSSVLTCSHHNRRARLSRLQQRGAHAGSERCTSGPGDRWRPMRQAAARERCTSAQLRRSNSRRRSPVRGRGPVRGRAGVPAPPGEPGVGERREAAGAGQQLGQGSAAAASEARTTRVRRRARTHGGAARGCPERILCDGVAHGCGGRSWGRGRLGAPGARVDASTLMSSSGTRSGGAARAAACGVVTEGSE